MKLLVAFALFASTGMADVFSPPGFLDRLSKSTSFRTGDFGLTLPVGWSVSQRFDHEKTTGFVFKNGEETFTFYVRPNTFDVNRALFRGGATLQRDRVLSSRLALDWRLQKTEFQRKDHRAKVFVAAISTEYRGQLYFGYAKSASEQRANTVAQSFVDAFYWPGRSLTGYGFKGKKYYLGFGRAYNSDPYYMKNEVKYDVLHTHDLFVSSNGGGYRGTKLIGSEANKTNITGAWKDYRKEMTWNDMYLQYSSSHGHYTGLEVGLTYNEIRDNVLKLPAKEKIVFTMACKAGNLVDSFNKKRSEWSYYKDVGRTLFVMASSKSKEDSATGPGKDGDEPGGPKGSAGSAFGHALWKAIIGYSDGYDDGVEDDFLSLEEIRDYTIWKTKRVGNHTPVVTGSYSKDLVMAKVPSDELLESLEGGTEGMSEEEVMRLIQSLR